MIEGLRPYSEYSESDMTWVGSIPRHWQSERGKWLFRKVNRPVEPGDDVVTAFRDGIVTLRKNRRVRGFTEALKEIGYQGIRRGDLVIHAMDAFAGAVGVSDSDGKGTPVYAVCVPRSGVSSYYYAYLTREMARTQWIIALSRGIRERSTDFRFEAFGNQRLPLPPILEQHAIVRFLNYADRRIRKYIAAKQKLIKLLEEQKQAIIHQAVTGQIDVRTGKPYPAYKASEVEWLGNVPKGWEVILNQRILKEEIRPHGNNVETQLSLSQQDGLIATANMRERSLQTSTFANWKLVFPGDLVLNRFKAHLGVFFAASMRGIVSFHYGVFVPRRQLDTQYFELLFHTSIYRCIYAGRSNGMTVGLQNLSNQNFYSVYSIVPPYDEQLQIVHFARKRNRVQNKGIELARREIELLREYRTRLISDVITGKLDVREAAARLPNEAADSTEADLEADDDAVNEGLDDEEVGSEDDED